VPIDLPDIKDDIGLGISAYLKDMKLKSIDSGTVDTDIE
jgi:hypothetical protein